MLQSILFFILGFLCSGFLALMMAPAIWRRAVMLTRKRIEASAPLSLAELQAEKDRMRAELAMTIRRLEMNVKSLREKSAAQAVEIGRGREELKRLAGERDERSQGLSQYEAKAGELTAELESHRQQLQILAGKLADAEKALEARGLELEKAGRLHDEASFAASSRQIELVARESEVEKLSGELAELHAAREAAERRQKELAAENLAARDALREEKQRAERMGRDLAQLREKLDSLTRNEEAPDGGYVVAEEELESAYSGMTSKLDSGAGDGDRGSIVSKLVADRDRPEQTLTAMGGENRRQQDRADVGERSRPSPGSDRRNEDARLREQMTDLAAEVIRLAAQLEGPGSAIATALSAPAAAGERGSDEAGKASSLADRVRALQRAASAE